MKIQNSCWRQSSFVVSLCIERQLKQVATFAKAFCLKHLKRFCPKQISFWSKKATKFNFCLSNVWRQEKITNPRANLKVTMSKLYAGGIMVKGMRWWSLQLWPKMRLWFSQKRRKNLVFVSMQPFILSKIFKSSKNSMKLCLNFFLMKSLLQKSDIGVSIVNQRWAPTCCKILVVLMCFQLPQVRDWLLTKNWMETSK